MHLLDLGHHLTVDMQASGGIHYEDIDKLFLCTINGPVNNIHGLFGGFTGEKFRAHFSGEGFKLLDSGRSIDIGRDNHDLFLFPLLQVTG